MAERLPVNGTIAARVLFESGTGRSRNMPVVEAIAPIDTEKLPCVESFKGMSEFNFYHDLTCPVPGQECANRTKCLRGRIIKGWTPKGGAQK